MNTFSHWVQPLSSLEILDKVRWGKAPTISRNRCICINNDPIEYILSCRQCKIYIPFLCKSILPIDTKQNLKFYCSKIATKRACCTIRGARRPPGWGKMPFQNSLNKYKCVS